MDSAQRSHKAAWEDALTATATDQGDSRRKSKTLPDLEPRKEESVGDYQPIRRQVAVMTDASPTTLCHKTEASARPVTIPQAKVSKRWGSADSHHK